MAYINRLTEPRAPLVWPQSSHLQPLAVADKNEEPTVAVPDRWMVRLGACIVDGSNTKVSV